MSEFNARDSFDKLMEIWRFHKSPTPPWAVKKVKDWRARTERWYMDRVLEQEYADAIYAEAEKVMEETPASQIPPTLIAIATGLRVEPVIESPKVLPVVTAPAPETLSSKIQKAFRDVWDRWPHKHGRYPVSEAACASAMRAVCRTEDTLEKILKAIEYYLSLVQGGDDHGYGLLGFLSSNMTDTGFPVWEVYYHRASFNPTGAVAKTLEIVWEQYPQFKGKTPIQKERIRFEFPSYVKSLDDCLKIIAATRAYCEERHDSSEDEKSLVQYTTSFQKWIQSWKDQAGMNEELGKMLAEQFKEVFPQLVDGLYDSASYFAMVLKQGKTLTSGVKEVADYFATVLKTEYNSEDVVQMLRKTLKKALRTVKTYTFS